MRFTNSCLFSVMVIGLGAFVCAGSSLFPELDVGRLHPSIVKAADLDGPGAKRRTRGIVVSRRFAIPEDALDPSQRNPHNQPSPSAGNDEAIDLDGARLVYRVNGGFAAVDNTLRI